MFQKSRLEKVEQYHNRLRLAFSDMRQIMTFVRNEELEVTVAELDTHLEEPFLFVIVGEVKAGKSSFINALLRTEREIAKVAPDPCTDQIQQLKYGEEASEDEVNPYFKKIYQPFDILKSISIVDTPGTNTIVDHHQEITERFVPIADLVVFVFEAKNPYRQSSWDFFEYIHSDWLKKVVFVLQQKDLVQPEDLAINIEGVRNYAIERGISDPEIFAVSALEEQQGKEASGFDELRSFIDESVQSGAIYFQKIANTLTTMGVIKKRLSQGLEDRKAQFVEDTEFRSGIAIDLEKQQNNSLRHIELLLSHLLLGYDKVANGTRSELKSGLSFFILLSKSFKSMFKKDENPKLWLDEVKRELDENMAAAMRDSLHDGVDELADSIQNMVRIIELKLQNDRRAILQADHGLYGHVATKRKNLMHEVRESFKLFVNSSDSFAEESVIGSAKSFLPDIATGSGLAVVGVILAAVTKGVVFDITGGVLTTVGLLLAGITAGFRRRKILASYDQEISSGRGRLEEKLSQALTEYVHGIRSKIDSIFHNFDTYLHEEGSILEEVEKLHLGLDQKMGLLSEDLEKSLKKKV